MKSTLFARVKNGAGSSSVNPHPHCELNPRAKRQFHKWKAEERILLCCMRRWFNFDRKQEATIFDSVFGTRARTEGFENGLPSSTLVTQWEDLGKRAHKDWIDVHESTNFDEGPSLFRNVLDQIQNASSALRIPVLRRSTDIDIRKFSRFREPPNQLARGGAQSDSIQESPKALKPPDGSDGPDGPDALVPDRSRVSQLFRHLPEIPPVSTDVPEMLFRFSNDDSMGINTAKGYVAEYFCNTIGDIPHPRERVREFQTLLESHARIRLIHSPFISTSVDPLVAIHRGLTKNENALISLIDSTLIKGKLIWKMNDLMRYYRIWTKGYTGSKEYLIWGSICQKAITSFKVNDLLKIADQHPDIKSALQLDVIANHPKYWNVLNERLAKEKTMTDIAAGKALGKLMRLLCLHEAYVNKFALVMNGSWSFAFSNDTSEFLSGVWQGYCSSISEPPTSPFPDQHMAAAAEDPFVTNGGPNKFAITDLPIRSHLASINPKSVDIREDDNPRMDTPCPPSRLVERPGLSGMSESQKHLFNMWRLPNKRKRDIQVKLFDSKTNSWFPLQEPHSTPAREQLISGPIGSPEHAFETENKRVKIEPADDVQDWEVIDAPDDVEGPAEDIQNAVIDALNEVEEPIASAGGHSRSSSVSSTSTVAALSPDAQFEHGRARTTRMLFGWEWGTM